MPPKGRGRGRGRGRGSASASGSRGAWLRRGAELLPESLRKRPRSSSGTSETSRENSRREKPTQGSETSSEVRETENQDTVGRAREDNSEPSGKRSKQPGVAERETENANTVEEQPENQNQEVVQNSSVRNEPENAPVVVSPPVDLNRSQTARRGRPMRGRPTSRVARNVTATIQNNSQVEPAGDNKRELIRRGRSEERERSDSDSENNQSRQSSVDRDEGGRISNSEDGHSEESTHDVWDEYLNRKKVIREKKEQTERVWTTRIKKYKNKNDDAWKALLLQTTKQFCGKDLDEVFTLFRFDEEVKAQLRRRWGKKVALTERSALDRKHLILVDYLLEEVESDSLFKAVTRMSLENGWTRRQMSIWKAYKVEIQTEESISANLIRRNLNRQFNHIHGDGDRGTQYVRSSEKDGTIVSCILTETIKTRARKAPKRSYSIVLVAINADATSFPYILVHGDPSEDMLEKLSECIGGTSYHYLSLCDVGYDTVLGACKQPTSEEIAASRGREIQENVYTEEQRAFYATKMIPLSEHIHNKGLPVIDDRGIKRKIVAEIMKMEPEEGGIKNLKLEFKPRTKKPITIKFLTKKGGSLSANVAKLYNSGAVKDGLADALLMAKDQKTNNLKLEASEGGKWKPVSRD